MSNQVTYGPYSPIVKKGDFYFISGHLGVDGSSKEAPETIKEQTKLLFSNLSETLSTQGLTLDDIVKTTIFLKNVDDFSTVNEIYVTYFSEPRPARSCIEASNLPKVTSNKVPVLIEIEAVAYKKESK